MAKVAVVRFPGTNCDRDVFSALEDMKLSPEWWWHEDQYHHDVDGVVIPGGFSFGDYLRCGALAARSPVISSVRKQAESGALVLGICNGFQVLCETHLLPGALVRNESLRFVDRWVDLKVENTKSQWGHIKEKKISLPVAHGEGRFVADDNTLKTLQDRGQIWLTYSEQSPNGAMMNIAGVVNETGNVAGLMPHPERAVQTWMGGIDGQSILKVFFERRLQ